METGLLYRAEDGGEVANSLRKRNGPTVTRDKEATGVLLCGHYSSHVLFSAKS